MAYQFSSAVSWGGGSNTGGDFSLYPDWFGKLSTSTTSYSGTASASYPPLSYNLKTETWGRTIPVSAGARRLSGHYIWAKVSQNLAQEQQYDADGTSTLDATSYLWNPLADIAVSFGYNGEPTVDVTLTKLYFDGVEVVLSSLDYVFYPGTEAQTADPSIVADKGAANTPAFRGQVYIVIKNVDLSKFGNRFPAVSALVNGASDEVFGERALEPFVRTDLSSLSFFIAADFDNNRAWGFAGGSTGGARILEYTLSGSGEVALASVSDELTDTGDVLIKAQYVSWHDRFLSADVNLGSLASSDGLTAWTRNGVLDVATAITTGVARDFRVHQFTPSVGSVKTLCWYLDVASGAFGDHAARVYEFDGSAFTQLATTTARIDGIGSTYANSTQRNMLGRASSGFAFGTQGTDSAEAWMMVGVDGPGAYKLNQLVQLIWNGSTLTATAVGSPLDIGYEAEITGIAYLAADESIVVTWVAYNSYSKGGIAKLTRAGAVTYNVDDLPPSLSDYSFSYTLTRWGSFHPNCQIGTSFLFASNALDGSATSVSTDDGSFTNYAFADLTAPEILGANVTGNAGQIFDTSGTSLLITKLFNSTAPRDEAPAVLLTLGSGGTATGTTLSGSIKGRATVLAELTAAQITTVNLDDAITGWLVWENSEFKSHLTNDGALFGFDYFESGTGIKCIRHVDGSSFTVNRVLTDADLLLMENDTATISRIDERDIPAIGKVNYIDPSVEYRVSSQRARRARYPIPAVNSNRTAEYTTSVIMDATTALSQCAKALFREDTGRVALTFMLKRTQLAVEVGDIVQLPAIDGKVFTVRIVEWILQPDFSMQCTGLVLLENEAISLTSSGGESFTYTNGAPRLMRSPFIRSTARVYPATIS